MRLAVAVVGTGLLLAACTGGSDQATSGSTGSLPVPAVDLRTTTSEAPPPTTIAPTTTSSAPSPPPPTAPADPCEPRGYVTGPEGFPVEPDPEDPWSMYADPSRLGRSLGRVYEMDRDDWEPRPFDWDQDGEPDRVSVDEDGGIAVATGSGTVTVTGVRTDFSAVGYYGTIHGNLPLDIADVTGDGRVDLSVATGGWVGVLAGRGPATTSETVAFDRIGIDAVGWLTPPSLEGLVQRPVTPGKEVYDTVPNGASEPEILEDLNGDGIRDLAIYGHLERTTGGSLLLLGQPCHP